MASIKDVAKRAGVSVATVSRVINNSESVKAETAYIVNEAIRELRYSPNLLARNLRRNETLKILVLLNTISNQFYSQVVRGIEERGQKDGYSIMISMTHGDKKLENHYINMLKTKLFDGAIILATENSGAFLEKELSNIPIVQALEPREDFKTSIVSTDNEKSSENAVSYLISLGHENIAFIGASDEYSSATDREKGYINALKLHNLPIIDDNIYKEGFSFNSGVLAASKIMARDILPTAIFCISDNVAAGVIRTFITNGIKVPEDISVMGFDNSQISKTYIPSITTVKQPQYDIGYTAMDLLIQRIAGSCEIQEIILENEIILRESVTKKLN